MFRHKFRRTFIAMFWGWVACNSTTITGMLISAPFKFTAFAEAFKYLLIYGFFTALYSAVLVLIAWLAVFLPTDLIVDESSPLRKPRNAAVTGFATGFLVILVPAWSLGAWIPGLLAAITGLTAALHVVIKHPRQIKPTLS